jgi:hypothetical protein
MNTSLLELVSWPLRLLFEYNVRQAYIYEHVFTPLLVACVLPTELWYFVSFSVVSIHLVLKEFIVDRIKHGSLNWENVTERCYGIALMGLYYAKEVWF